MLRQLAWVGLTLCALVCWTATASAQQAYGVDSTGKLFWFDVNTPSVVNDVGVISGIALNSIPEAIDFRPGSLSLYAIDIGPNTSQLYTIDLNTAVATPVGAGFTSTGVGYDLLGNQKFGFDFNPTTLQMSDGSMRIRLVASGGSNLRLHSATGGIAGVDGQLLFGSGASPFVDGAAYINNNPTIGGATTLFDMDSRNDELLIQNPPNAGTVTSVGPFGVTIDALSGIGFDIYTIPGNTDTSLVGDSGFAVFQRTATAGGAYLLYDVDLATGATTNGAIVGPAATPYDFTGGFAVAPLPVPEPSAIMLGLLAVAGGVAFARRKAA
ncbi:MAG: DUF4394 domain-containing protein [Pirellulales bacterium]|nr:DUF4394 domain-containing protein [Pirellulales bacterium]